MATLNLGSDWVVESDSDGNLIIRHTTEGTELRFNKSGRLTTSALTVNDISDVPSADHATTAGDADYAATAGDADTIGGKTIYVQSTAPSNPSENDVWIDTS